MVDFFNKIDIYKKSVTKKALDGNYKYQLKTKKTGIMKFQN